MKALVLSVSLFVASQAFAKDINFKCQMNDNVSFKSQFAVEGSFDSDAKTFSDMELNFTFKKAGYNSQSTETTVTRDGNIVSFEAGSISNKAVYSLTSSVVNDEMVFIGLNVDLPGAFTSLVRFADGTTFFSNCKSL